ncbi:protein TSSC4 [Rhinatrema bivittatum]|uniref:protein TSSC4 n=1 Tax=Rhinatrema bivittatum TaxID=194408 RepID=UPI00112CF523|nr:protein TSSC4 [Rhinatrema bivittatum]XP_029438382.1 protein TSSC4 [Rhinatrema bivittatum]XP_029438383.1 protein TSSC4 [Rhinatrema bivittatum]XP_029438385.1 protein TSSC4 [Rhinatrema bivittatum]XP_029438386.1 protein TSSC4 [Rhinatrema bivittatum]XP_029438387.1 protein TSSC4 [Rhinatrema bivittatum]XP_029438388.1 protein TSSC4 [Rhinatrema bivittatum]XP_029438389.1 protein TSSC4 [Rhinatrema bivittatum]XP_029438390.1 protein TSSC4 [Rhinatrema bivittatum]
MADKGDESPEDIVAGSAAECGKPLPSDTASLSDSDPEDAGLPDDAEVNTISPGEEEEEDEEMDHPSMGDAERSSLLGNRQKSAVQPFHLKGMSSTFSLRSQNIFDCLEGVAKRTVPSLSEDNAVDGRFKRPFPPTPTFLNRSVGGGVAQECKPPLSKSPKAVPDYVAHPERWTKYSLEEVPESSDKTNRAVALKFLEDVKNRKEAGGSAVQEIYTPSFNQDPSSCGAGRIIFAKPTKVGVKREWSKDDDEKKSKSDKEGKSPKRTNVWREEEEEVGSGHLESHGGSELKNGRAGKKETKAVDTTIQLLHEEQEPTMDTVEFHSSKKKSRKHIRAKVDPEEEGDSS